jgi:hypothetical protein
MVVCVCRGRLVQMDACLLSLMLVCLRRLAKSSADQSRRRKRATLDLEDKQLSIVTRTHSHNQS